MMASLVLAMALVQESAAGPAPDITILRDVLVAPAESIGVHMAGSSVTLVSASAQRLPLVLIPGLLGSSYGFRNIVPELSKTRPIYIIDPLGTGSSSSPEDADYSLTAQSARVAAAAAALGIRRALFACHSTGASVCYRLALSHPDLVAGIVSINGGPTEAVRTPGLSFALTFAPLIRLFGGDGWARGKVRDGLKKSSFDPSWVTEDVVQGYTAHYNGVKAVLKTLKRMSDAKEPAPLAPQLRAVRAPVLLLVGAGSTTGAIAAEELETLSTLPSLMIDSIPDAGQYIHEERPDAVIAAIELMSRFTNPPPVPAVGRPTVSLPDPSETPRRTSGG